jgi:dolichol-phosphate mannosyltransferase
VKLAVVIPARNEASNIGTTLDQISARLVRERIPYELIVVDDGSVDGTADEVSARIRVNPAVRLVPNPPPHGFGRAVRRGLEVFQADAVAIMMGDGSDAADDLVRYYYLLRDRAECAFGSRFIAGSRVERYPIVKRIVNRAANTFIRVLFGLSYNDVTNAFKAYRAHVIRGCMPLVSPHFNLTVELPLKAIVRGYSYEVIPISWRQRKAGISSLHMREMGSRYLFIVLYLWLEKMLARGDYHRPVGEARAAWGSPDEGEVARESRRS